MHVHMHVHVHMHMHMHMHMHIHMHMHMHTRMHMRMHLACSPMQPPGACLPPLLALQGHQPREVLPLRHGEARPR